MSNLFPDQRTGRKLFDSGVDQGNVCALNYNDRLMALRPDKRTVGTIEQISHSRLSDAMSAFGRARQRLQCRQLGAKRTFWLTYS